MIRYNISKNALAWFEYVEIPIAHFTIDTKKPALMPAFHSV